MQCSDTLLLVLLQLTDVKTHCPALPCLSGVPRVCVHMCAYVHVCARVSICFLSKKLAEWASSAQAGERALPDSHNAPGYFILAAVPVAGTDPGRQLLPVWIAPDPSGLP